MKKATFFTLCLFFLTSSQYLHSQWAKTYGGIYDDYASSIQQTSDGGYIVAGSTETFGIGDDDLWILKLDSKGNIEWQKAYGGSKNEWTYEVPECIYETNDGGFIAVCTSHSFGSRNSEFWVLKLKSNGDIEWQNRYGGDSWDCPYSVQQTNDGGYIVAGFTNSFGPGSNDYWIVKLSSNGNIEWQKAYGGGPAEHAYSVRQTADGGYIVAGNSYTFGDGSYSDIWILKLYSNGDIEWQKTYGGGKEDIPYSIEQTSDGGYIVGAYSYSFKDEPYNVWILKLYSNGDIEWQKIYGDSLSDHDAYITETDGGGYIVSSWFYESGGPREGRILKLLSNGDVEWQRTYGGSDDDGFLSIRQATDGGYIAAGWTHSMGAGDADFVVAKLYPNGSISPSCSYVTGSNVPVMETSVSPVDTNSTPVETSGSPVSTNATPTVTNAVVNLICEAQKHSLTINASEGGTTDPSPGTYTYYEKADVMITAIPDNGYVFDGWSGDASGKTNPITVSMDSDKSITASFITDETIEYSLTIAAYAGGTTDPSPGTYTHDKGTQVTIKAIPNSGYSFGGWSGDASGTTNPVTITMDSDKSVSASFIEESSEEARKGRCFIATACFGTPLAEEVKILSAFRDKYLLTNPWGQTLVSIYYIYSPEVVDFIVDKEYLKMIVRECLKPFIRMIKKGLE